MAKGYSARGGFSGGGSAMSEYFENRGRLACFQIR